MNRISAFKYLCVLILPALSYLSFQSQGWITFAPLIFAFAFIPFLELFFKPDSQNLSDVMEQVRKDDFIYDVLIYITVPIQIGFLWLFLDSIQSSNLDTLSIVGRTASMGLLCGVMGINVAHELGHRKTKHERLMAKLLLLTSLYMHFYIEHNKGHHKNVSTLEDPSSARKGESLFGFWIRSVVYSYFSAWKIEKERLKKSDQNTFSIHNEMLRFQLIQLLLLLTIYSFFGWVVLGLFVASATMGFLLLETVNYIEHYGLARKKNENGYERVLPAHSWNSDHPVGRLMLFELSRHSDHHFIASRKYQILRHMEGSPQMPTGYPGMMLLALIPPIWFWVMKRRIERFTKSV